MKMLNLNLLSKAVHCLFKRGLAYICIIEVFFLDVQI